MNNKNKTILNKYLQNLNSNEDIEDNIEQLAESIMKPYFDLEEDDIFEDLHNNMVKNTFLNDNIFLSMEEDYFNKIKESMIVSPNTSATITTFETPPTYSKKKKSKGKDQAIKSIGRFRNKLKNENVDINKTKTYYCSECYKLESTERPECLDTFLGIYETALDYTDKSKEFNKDEFIDLLYDVTKIRIMKEIVRELLDKE